jgi:hypothetical protein
MTVSLTNQTLITGESPSVAEVLLVRVSPAAIVSLQPDTFSQADSGSDALGMLRLFRFHLLVASLDVPDMRPWDLFHKARRAQARLQCVLLDERMTLNDEQYVRQSGGGAFASNDPAICAALIRSSTRLTRIKNNFAETDAVPAQHDLARAPP